MKIRFDPSVLRETTFKGHVGRFIAGGLVTVATGLLAKAVGPSIGGLFLAFPSIFPIGMATLEKLENEKVQGGGHGYRARRAAVAEAAGASMGAVGLVGFAATMWGSLAQLGTAPAFTLAAAVWMALSLGLFAVRKRLTVR